MKNRPPRLGFLIFTTTALSVVVAGLGLYFLFIASLQQQQARLSDTLASRLEPLEESATGEPEPAPPEETLPTEDAAPEAAPSPPEPSPPAALTPAAAIALLDQTPALEPGVEVFVGERVGDQLEVFWGRRGPEPLELRPLAASATELAEPLRAALNGNVGTMLGRNHSGEWVVAAYQPIEGTPWGAVAQVKLLDLGMPFLRVGVVVLASALLLSTLVSLLYARLTQRAVKALLHTESRYRTLVMNAADGAIALNDRAIIEVFNRAAEQLFGYPAAQVVGKRVDMLLVSFAEGEVEAALLGAQGSASASPDPNSVALEKAPTSTAWVTARRELLAQRQDGTIFPVELSISRLWEGQEKRFLLTVRDISERKQAEETLKKRTEELELRVEERTTQLMNLNEELLHEIDERNRAEVSLHIVERRFESLFTQTDIGIIQTSRSGQFLKVNPRFAQLVGYAESDLCNKTFQEITHPEDLAHVIAQFRRVLAGEITQLSLEQRYMQSNGTPVWVQLSGTAVRDSSGEVDYFLAAVADAGERVVAKAALASIEATLNSFYSSSRAMMGVVELLDGDLRHISDNPTTTEFFRVSPLAMHNRLASEMGVPADIREHWLERCRESATLGQPVRFEYAHEIDLDGDETELRWLAATVAPIPNSERFAYIVEDITTQRTQAESLRRAQEQLDTSSYELAARQQEMGQLTVLTDFLRVSRTLQEAYDAIAELIAPLFPHCSGAVFALNEAGTLAEAIATWGDSLQSELHFPPADSWALRLGKPHWADNQHPRLFSPHIHRDPLPVETFSIPLLAQGQTLGLLHLTAMTAGALSPVRQQFAQTVAEQLAISLANVKLRLSLDSDSIRDPLTGLFNRAYLEAALEREINRAGREQQPLGFVLLALEGLHFQSDAAHPGSEARLQALGTCFRKLLRPEEVAARWSLSTLALLLPKADSAAAQQRAEQLQAGLKQFPQAQGGGPWVLSAGAAAFPERGMTWEAIAQAAEATLQRAQAEGGDRVYSA